jgi:hypothetical protein
MKDWKIWSKREKEFIYPKKLHGKLPVCYDFYSGDLFFGCNDAVDGLSKDEFIFLEDIGLKDIDGKIIYADSSIVEFMFYEFFKNNPHNKRQLTGYFKWSQKNLCYGIQVLNDKEIIGFSYDCEMVDSFKIIDTIQENKLGLIK